MLTFFSSNHKFIAREKMQPILIFSEQYNYNTHWLKFVNYKLFIIHGFSAYHLLTIPEFQSCSFNLFSLTLFLLFSAYVLVNNRTDIKLSILPANLLGFLSTLMPIMSLYLILVICVARMIGIVKPLRYKSLITFRVYIHV